MSKRITVPSTIQEAQDSLNGLGALMTAKEWERAAIVYAFTEPRPGARSDLSGISDRLSCAAFARLGITGLRDQETVAAYRRAWAEHGSPVKPGDTITLPDIPWGGAKYGETGPEARVRQAQATLKDPGLAVEVMREPRVQETVAQAQDTLAVERINPGYKPRHVEPEPAPAVDEYRLRRAAMLVLDALDKEVKGEWRASGPWWGQVLAFIQEWAGRRSDQEALPSVHESIADFLAAAREA